jgi:transposase
MTKKTTQQQFNGNPDILYLAFEMGSKNWKLGFSVGFGQPTRLRGIEAGDLTKLKAEIASAKKRFKLGGECPVMSCYEAGRDGFWLHRFLVAEGIENFVVDSASIEVNRRKRRAKSDRLDANSLVRMLMRYVYDKKVWSVVCVPSAEEEDRRQLHRDLAAMEKEKTQKINRIRGLLATQGVWIKGSIDFSDAKLESIRTPDNKTLFSGLKDRIRREWDRLVFLKEQIAALTNKRDEAIKKNDSSEPGIEKIRQLQLLRAIGPVGSWVLVKEIFGWRKFKNGKQVGSLVGLAPTPYQSGDSNHELGISKAGIVPVRRVAIELAWNWLRYQPNSKLSRWYETRFSKGGKKARKVGIVALARRVIIDLWRYLETGLIPEGAELKSEA